MQKLTIHEKYVIIRSVDMQMMLNIIEKISQLTELKKFITSENQNDSHHFINDKHSFTDSKHSSSDDKHLSDHKLSATAEKTRNEFLNDNELISEKIEKMNIAQRCDRIR